MTFDNATICPGVIGRDGTVTGRMTDCEVFDCFNIDMTQARDFETGDYLLDAETRKRLSMHPNSGDLWNVRHSKGLNRKYKKMLEVASEKQRQANLAQYMKNASLGLDLYSGQAIVENNELRAIDSQRKGLNYAI
jgi:hypothetical protein